MVRQAHHDRHDELVEPVSNKFCVLRAFVAKNKKLNVRNSWIYWQRR